MVQVNDDSAMAVEATDEESSASVRPRPRRREG